MTDQGPVAPEPLCLSLVISTSWRLRGVKRPPDKEATESSHRGALAPANAGALSLKGNEAKAECHSPKRILVVATGNFLHEHHDPAPQGGIINSHERSD